MSDDEAVTRVLAGDLEAFGVLHGRYDHMVRVCLFKTVRDWSAVDELDQDTWVSVYNSLAGFFLGTRFSSWLYSIARHVGLSFRRHRQSPARPTSLDLIEPETGPSCPGPEELHEQAATKERLERNLAKLSPAQRRAVWLHEGLGLTYDEMEQMSGRNPATLASDVHRGLEHLRRNWD